MWKERCFVRNNAADHIPYIRVLFLVTVLDGLLATTQGFLTNHIQLTIVQGTFSLNEHVAAE